MIVIDELNQDRLTEHSAVFGLTAYSDLSKDEFLHLYLQPRLADYWQLKKPKLGYNSNQYYNAVKERTMVDGLPLRVDW